MEVKDYYASYVANREALVLKGLIAESSGELGLALTEKGNGASVELLEKLGEENVLLLIVYIGAALESRRKK